MTDPTKEIARLKATIKALEAQRGILGAEVVELSLKGLLQQIAALTPTSKSKKEGGQSKSAERRQLPIMFCDLVGSTALSAELDAEDYRKVIINDQQVATKVIKQYGGHIAQYLGDGLMVYFGYPKGLENAPGAAVRAGLEILEAVQRANKEWLAQKRPEIDIRLGIHTGLVVIDHQLQLALGGTVNIAARLEALAPVNGLVVSPQTNKLVQG